MVETGELISNPSNMSLHIIEIVEDISQKINSEIKKKGVLNRIKNEFNFYMYLKEGYKEYYSFLKGYNTPKDHSSEIKNLNLLFKEFSEFYRKLIFHNTMFAKLILSGEEIVSNTYTMEDKKLKYLKDFYKGRLSKKELIKVFGHYSLDPYELSSRRFSEYSYGEIMKLAKLASDVKSNNKEDFHDYLNKSKKADSSIMISLRELAKYQSIHIINEIRNTLLSIEKSKKIDNIFSMSYKDLTKLCQET